MVFYRKFNKFSPLSGDVPSLPLTSLPAIADRARVMLREFSEEQFEMAAKRIYRELDDHFHKQKENAISRLLNDTNAGDESLGRFFDWDEGTSGNGRWLFKAEMEDKLCIPTATNSSEVDALRNIIDDRDYIGWNEATLPKPREFPEGRDFQLFAVLALWLLADALNFLNQKAVDLSIAGEHALKAMDAVCYAEHLYESAWLVSYTKNVNEEAQAEALLRQRFEHQELLRHSEKMRLEQMREEMSKKSEKLNLIRHAKNHEAKQLVIDEWKKRPSAFISAEKAGGHFADWLEAKGFKKYEPRTVTTWIRSYAKEVGIRLR